MGKSGETVTLDIDAMAISRMCFGLQYIGTNTRRPTDHQGLPYNLESVICTYQYTADASGQHRWLCYPDNKTRDNVHAWRKTSPRNSYWQMGVRSRYTME